MLSVGVFPSPAWRLLREQGEKEQLKNGKHRKTSTIPALAPASSPFWIRRYLGLSGKKGRRKSCRAAGTPVSPRSSGQPATRKNKGVVCLLQEVGCKMPTVRYEFMQEREGSVLRCVQEEVMCWPWLPQAWDLQSKYHQ